MASPRAKYSKSVSIGWRATAIATTAVEPHSTKATTTGMRIAAVATRFQVTGRSTSRGHPPPGMRCGKQTLRITQSASGSQQRQLSRVGQFEFLNRCATHREIQTDRLPGCHPSVDELAFAFGAKKSDGDNAVLCGAVAPSVARAVLNDAIASFEMDFCTVIEFEIDLAGNDDVEVDGIGGVHAGMIAFENFDHAGQLELEFCEGFLSAEPLGSRDGVGWKSEKAKAVAILGRKVARLRGRSAVGLEFGGRIAAPKEMEFVAWEEREGDRLDARILHKYGLAGGGLAGDDAA